ncbi:MAG: chemotaxis-specific protein-glutamate methyltransferase CheB [Solirubrobacteraceae bacterium]|nr:chemotaxis-specific protein-glutamate methyltransferase CheB [Solirubrobacteraceae bacterium]
MPAGAPIRVVLADDSGFMRALVGRALEDAGFDVVGRARDGAEALTLCAEHRPDVLTLDMAMPGLGGLDVLARIGRDGVPALPVVVVSAFSPADGARAVDALTAGAFDLVLKPGGSTPLTEFADELAAKVRAAAASGSRSGRPTARRAVRAAARPRDHGPSRAPSTPTTTRPSGTDRPTAVDRPASHRGDGPLLVVASSTGGPRALATLIPALPARIGRGAVVVQHMPPGFTSSLAERLDRASRPEVREAADGDRLDPGRVLIAPGGRHLRFDRDDVARLADDAPIGGLRPRADLTIADLARRHRSDLLLVVLTGMGRDGAEGAAEVRRHGGTVWSEAEETCAVYGMPRAVAEAGLSDRVLPIDELATAVAAAVERPALIGARR